MIANRKIFYQACRQSWNIQWDIKHEKRHSLLARPAAGGRNGRSEFVDRLHALEARSICIFRRVPARLERVAPASSLGKDSSPMIRFARKACRGRVPLPVPHADAGKKFAETYAFRARCAKELKFLRWRGGGCLQPALKELFRS